ncbi:MAG TPA: glucoamylase family protein [Pyrinomonadaceae bacterium]|nr:glucoamylase family protein [Pyrinomonadaceae bacterium]
MINHLSASNVRHLRRVSLELIFVLLIPLFTAQTALAFQASRPLSTQDEAFVEDLSRQSFQYFWEQANPKTGLVPDRARMDGSPLPESHHNIASIAATGFGLTGLCVAAERNWITPAQAKERTRNTLRFFANEAFQQHGWFYHWLDAITGERRWQSEVSSIDTALLLGGVLTVRQCFREDIEINRLATQIYERVDFKWMLNGHPRLLSHGWKPETGFLRARWDTYSEDLILYLLAIGSPTHPISPNAWYAIWRDRYRYEGFAYFTSVGVPLFMHQYSHAWVDFRNRRETRGDRIDYFQNSINATLAHRAFCINLAHQFPGFGPNVWGITASDSAKGYLAWGGPPHDPAIDGTVVPCAAGGSLMFTPEHSVAALRTMREKWGERIYGKYGFVDAFNPNNGWVNPDVIGIDVGITLLSAENMRTGNIWRWFMRNREIPRAMQRIGLLKYEKRSNLYNPTQKEAMKRFAGWEWARRQRKFASWEGVKALQRRAPAPSLKLFNSAEINWAVLILMLSSFTIEAGARR